MTTKFKPGDAITKIDRPDLGKLTVLDPKINMGSDTIWVKREGSDDRAAFWDFAHKFAPATSNASHDYKPYDRIRINTELTISHVDVNTVRVMHPEWQEGVNLRHSDLAALKPERLPPALKVGDRVRTLGGVHGFIKALHNDSAWIYHPQLDEYRTFEAKSLERVAD